MSSVPGAPTSDLTEINDPVVEEETPEQSPPAPQPPPKPAPPKPSKPAPAPRPRPEPPAEGRLYKAGDCAGFYNGMPKSGHNIASIVTKQSVDPISKLLVNIYELLCTRCGRSLEEIRQEYQKKPAPPKGAPK